MRSLEVCLHWLFASAVPPAVLTTLSILSGVPAQAAEPVVEDKAAFCESIKEIAEDKRLAAQLSELKALKSVVNEKLALLEQRKSDFLSARRDQQAFLDKAQTIVVEVYAKMRPDAAASRLAMLQEPLAAAILVKLNPRQSGVILNEMDEKKAAALTTLMAKPGPVNSATNTSSQ